MTARHFRGIPSIQEVECWGGHVDSDAKLISLQMFRNSESSVLASLNLYTNNCMTHGEFSSCFIDSQDVHNSRLRLLVHDLAEGESREFRCTALAMTPAGSSKAESWTFVVTRESECCLQLRRVTRASRLYRLYLCVCVFVCLLVVLNFIQLIYVFMYLFMYLFIHVFIYSCIYLFIHLCIYLF